MSYRLKGIEIAGFRGFNDAQYCSLDNPLVLLYAPNGHGKSSLCEAIEWAIYGNTARRTRGEKDIQKREFENSLRNRHYPADSEAYVTLYLYHDSNDVEIKRVIDKEEGLGILYVDGKQADSLSALGVSGQVRHPLILQHGIRDFVFAKPTERFNLISAQLGMGALNALQASIQNASRSFKTKSEDVSKGQTFRLDLVERCSNVPNMSQIKAELENEELTPSTFRLAISSVFKTLFGKELPDDAADAITEIDSEMNHVIARTFDFAKLAIDQEVQHTFESIAIKISELEVGISTCESDLLNHKHSRDIARERELVEIARKGFPLIDEESPICVLCGQALTALQLQAIKETSANNNQEFDPAEFLVKQVSVITNIGQDASLLMPRILGEDDQQRLRNLLEEPDKVLGLYGNNESVVKDSREALEKCCEAKVQLLTDLRGKVSEGDLSQTDVEPTKQIASSLREALKAFELSRTRLMTFYGEIRQLVQENIASSIVATQLETLKICLAESGLILLACNDHVVEAQVEDSVKLIQEFSRKTHRQILAAKSTEMMKWFATLHPGQEVKFKGMNPSATQINLLGEVFGEEVNVSSIFSEAQLNCLGLSFYAVTSDATDNPFGFVVIDDPVQSMDQAHIENFKDGYLRKMLDAGKQIILLTHMQTLSLSVDTLYRHLGPLSLEVATYSKEGPKIIGSEEALNRMLKDIHFYMDGDSVRRRHAGAVLREFLERFAKELYRKNHGTLPKKYEGAMWTTLKDLIHEGGLDLKDEGRVFESYSFCVSFPHDDETKEPPTSTEIEAQYMRMKLLKELYLQ